MMWAEMFEDTFFFLPSNIHKVQGVIHVTRVEQKATQGPS